MTVQSRTSKKRKAVAVASGPGNTVYAPIDAESLPMDRAAAATLIESWLDDSSGYDEEAWPQLQAAIEANRLAQRPRFHG